jgi:hypothetical protein
MYTALKARMPFLDINQEREFGYAGYAGMLELARQLCLTIESPIWPAVRSAPPWAAHQIAQMRPREPWADPMDDTAPVALALPPASPLPQAAAPELSHA